MRKIISGKVYDTETATKVGEHDHYDNGNWFSVRELHRKKTGEYFFAIFGNRNELFAPKDHIVPASLDDSKKWAEEYLDVEDYEKEFGEVLEDETKKNVTICITTTAHDRGKAHAQRTGQSLSAVISAYLETL